jgi:TatD DNase family protein
MEWSDEIYFSFSGIVTYKSALEIQDAAARIPLSRLLIETDAPYLSPAPDRSAINEPARTTITLAKVQSLRNESPELVEQTIYENSLQFYRL